MRHRIRSYRRLLAMFYVFLFCISLSPVYAQVFNTVVVDAIGDVGQYSSIALDSDNIPHISYFDADNGDLKCADMSNGTWSTQVVDGVGDVGLYSSLVIDSWNNRYISYYYEGNEYLKLAYTETSTSPWEKVLGPSVRIVSAKSTSLVLESMNINPMVAFFDDNSRELKFALYDRADALPPAYKVSGWATEWIQASPYSMEDVSLVLDSGNEPHLTYIELTGTTAELKYCKKECDYYGCSSVIDQSQPTGVGTWTFETVDATGSAGESASISLDGNNTPHISYYDAWSRYLKYASKVGGNWVIETVDDAANVGKHNAIAVDADNNPHISYYDAANGALKYATKKSGEWSIHTVDNTSLDVGLYTSIALDANDNPHISYYDAENHNLKYASLQKERICFPPHRGVPYNNNPPVIDGEVRDDVGWRGAYRVTYGNGADPAHMAFQALKHRTDPYLYLSFEVRNDPTFDDDDVVVICLRPDANGGSANDDRRLFIFPLCSPADPGCDLNTDDDDVDRLPRLVEVWSNSDIWTSSSQPGGLDVKVRSYPDGSSLAWNLEVRIPTNTAIGGSEWIDFSDDFLFYFNVIRVSSPDPASEFLWPRNAPEVIGDIYTYAFSSSEWGMGSRSNTEVCKGVFLRWFDIGTTNDPASSIKFTPPPDPNIITNTFFADVKNNTEINGVPQPAADVSVRFRIANWGIPSLGDWTDIPATNPGCPDLTLESNPTCTLDVPAAVADAPGIKRFNLKWKVADSVRYEYQPPNDHQCILAELDSWSNTNIVTKSVHRNMDFVPASSFSRSAEISAKGYGPPPEGKTAHEFLLNITTRELGKNNGIPIRGFVDDKSPVSSLRWAAHGYRYSGRSIIIHDTKYDLVDPVGSFGYIVRHEGLVKDWQHQLVGAEMIGTNLYKLSIPAEGVRTITTRIEPQEYGKWTISAHSGAAVPTGTFANDFDPGFNVLLDAGYHFSPQLSVVAFFGYNDFKSKTAGIDDNYWINLSANVRYRRPLNRAFSYYVGAGPGIYIPENGDTEFGANAGLGINYEYSPLLTFELGADYHTIFDPDIQFVHSHAGVILRF